MGRMFVRISGGWTSRVLAVRADRAAGAFDLRLEVEKLRDYAVVSHRADWHAPEHELPWQWMDDLLAHIEERYRVKLLWLRPISADPQSSVKRSPLTRVLTEGDVRPHRIPEGDVVTDELVAIWEMGRGAPPDVLAKIVPGDCDLAKLKQRILERVPPAQLPSPKVVR